MDWCSVYLTPQGLPKYMYLSSPLIFPTTYNGIRTKKRPVLITPGAAPIATCKQNVRQKFKFSDGYKSTMDWCSVYLTPQGLPKYMYVSPPLIFPTTYNGIRTKKRPVWITPGAAPIHWMGPIRNPHWEQKRTEGYVIVSSTFVLVDRTPPPFFLNIDFFFM
jgi:hypothetical protein